MSELDRTTQVTCLGCGCACDDIDVTVRDGVIVETLRACDLGAAWFGSGRIPARTLVSGRPSTSHDALSAAVAFLSDARHALVYLAPGLTCEAQREAVALADLLGASIDSVTSGTIEDSILAAQERGRATATLGEVRNRADLVVWWGADPALRYPRFASRYAPDPVGIHLPDGRRSRTVIGVDVGGAHAPADVDWRLTLTGEEEADALAVLAGDAALADTALTPASPFVERCRPLAAALRAARYGVIVADGEAAPSSPRPVAPRAEMLIAVAQAFNAWTRCSLVMLRAGGNRSGADAVLTWQTGYPMAVDFSRGSPWYRPYDGHASALLARGDVDAVLVVGDGGAIPAPVAAAMAQVATAVIGPRASEGRFAGGTVAVDTGVAGIHEAGLALRMDDVPLPLRPPLASPMLTQSFIRAMSERIVTRRRGIGERSGEIPIVR